MAKFDFNIGAKIHCQGNEDCGKLHKVVLDSHTYRVTDLIVERGFLQKTDRVVPVTEVDKATEDDIYLSIESDKLDDYPEYNEKEFKEPLPNWEEVEGYDFEKEKYRTQEVRHWTRRFGMLHLTPVVPQLKRRVHEGISKDKAVIERGTPIKQVANTIGKVDHLLVDRESGEIKHIVMDKGLFAHSRVIPISMIDDVTEEAVFIKKDENLEELPRYTPRDSADILAELIDKLQAASPDFDNVKAKMEKGVVQLSGSVKDVASKRRAEATARSVDGVVDVEDVLNTDTAIMARVTVALEEDARTDLANIEVISEHGIVTLKGQVDNAEVKEAAEKIASTRDGVISVTNALEIKEDEDTAKLGYVPIFRVKSP